MTTEVKLPQPGQTMKEGTIVDCKVKVGDEVKKDNVISEIETDKVGTITGKRSSLIPGFPQSGVPAR